jgi:hypothetical protein
MNMEIRFNGNTMSEVIENVIEFLSVLKGINVNFTSHEKEPDTLVEVPKIEEPQEPIRPVLTQEQMAQNVANAPEHTEPPQPTLEDVRKALKALRDSKGASAVKELLKAYGVNSVPELKPEDYRGAYDRAMVEV